MIREREHREEIAAMHAKYHEERLAKIKSQNSEKTEKRPMGLAELFRKELDEIRRDAADAMRKEHEEIDQSLAEIAKDQREIEKQADFIIKHMIPPGLVEAVENLKCVEKEGVEQQE